MTETMMMTTTAQANEMPTIAPSERGASVGAWVGTMKDVGVGARVCVDIALEGAAQRGFLCSDSDTPPEALGAAQVKKFRPLGY